MRRNKSKTNQEPNMPRRPVTPTPGTPRPMPIVPPQMPMPIMPYQPEMPYQAPMPPNMTPDVGRPQVPPVMQDTLYLQGYLKSVIGEKMRVDFLIGTNTLVDKAGTLMSVGIDHIVLQEAESDDLLVCDLYSIKFVKIFY